MLDNEIFGLAKFNDCRSIVTWANKLSYKASKAWTLPKWETLKKMYPFSEDLNFPDERFLWTDNATSASYTAKKLNLANGVFIDCSSKEDYNKPAFFRLFCNGEFESANTEVYEYEDLQFIILPFGKMTFDEVDELNKELAAVNYAGFKSFSRPSLEQLIRVQSMFSENYEGTEDAWFWSLSEGGKFKAHWIHMGSGEIYACKKTADYSVNRANSMVLVG